MSVEVTASSSTVTATASGSAVQAAVGSTIVSASSSGGIGPQGPPGEGGGDGDYLPLAGGTMTGNIVFDETGGQFIGKGSFDRGGGGSYGIELVCAVGYKLNWQSGWIRAIEQNNSDARPLYLDSAAGTTLRAWDEAEDEGVEVAHDGITLPNGVTIEPIADGLRFNVGYSSLSFEAGDLLACRATGGGLNAIVCLSPIEFQPDPNVATPMKVDPAGLRFPDETSQTTAWTGSFSYDDLEDLPSLFSGDYDDLSGLPTLFSGAYADLSGLPSLFSGAYADLSGLPTLFDGAYTSLTSVPSTFAPSAHKSSHATGGADALTAADVGAAASSHSHSWSDITSGVPSTFTPTSHTHGLGDLTQGGATTGQVIAWSGSAWAPATVSGGGGGSTSASDLTSGTLADARLSDKARAAANLYLWSNFR